jgi:hypothetical protein
MPKKMKAKDVARLCADISRLRRKFRLNDIKSRSKSRVTR